MCIGVPAKRGQTQDTTGRAQPDPPEADRQLLHAQRITLTGPATCSCPGCRATRPRLLVSGLVFTRRCVDFLVHAGGGGGTTV